MKNLRKLLSAIMVTCIVASGMSLTSLAADETTTNTDAKEMANNADTGDIVLAADRFTLNIINLLKQTYPGKEIKVDSKKSSSSIDVRLIFRVC